MKVLHVIPSVSDQSGGPAQAIFPMCRALRARDIEVLLVTTDADLDLKESLPAQINYKEVPTLFFPSQFGRSFKFSRPLAHWLDENVAKFDLVHVHAVFNHSCIAAARACRKHNVPYVVRPLGTLDPWGMRRKRLMKSAFWHLSGKGMLRGAAFVHYTTSAEMKAVEESLKINHGRVVPLGIELEPGEAPVKDGEAVRKFEIALGDPFVLVLSRLHPKKGLDVLIDAFLKIITRPEFSRWRLILAGDGPEDHVRLLKRKVVAGVGGERVLFTGWLEGDDKKVFLQRAALMALPSYSENFGLCLMEALSFGVPVVVSPQVNLSDAISDAGAGWISEVEITSLVSTLSEAMGSEKERVTRGLAGKELSLKFTWPEVASQLASMYTQIKTGPDNIRNS